MKANSNAKVVIVGGGPAGTSLAIRLVQRGFRVTLIEREKFPRKKLCGEFISPECLRHFQELGVYNDIISAAGDRISETVFYSISGKSIGVPSNWLDSREAVSLSRSEMDILLMERARTLGAEVLEDVSVVGVEGEDKWVKSVIVRHSVRFAENIAADIFIDATGRNRILAKLLSKQVEKHSRPSQKPRLVGFKTHLRNAKIARGRCELYSFPGGYGGLSNVENGLANLCFLMRAEAARKLRSDPDRIVKESILANARARITLQNAEPVHQWLAVAIDRFGINDPNLAENAFAVGDAAAFIDPFTGSGILMALESSGMLADCMTNVGALKTAGSDYEAAIRKHFSKRLAAGGLIRRAVFMPRAAGTVISILAASRKARILLARATRDARI